MLQQHEWRIQDFSEEEERTRLIEPFFVVLEPGPLIIPTLSFLH